MKSKLTIFFLIAPLLLVISCKHSDPALAFDTSLIRSTGKYDVIDYFLLLPHLALPQNSTESRRKLIDTANQPAQMLASPTFSMDILDRANGYLRLTMIGGGQTDQYEVTYWTQSGQPDTVGVNYTTIGMPGASSKPVFYRLVDNHWRVVTEQVFPNLDPARFGPFQEVSFPQSGTSITIKTSQSEVKLVVKWKDGKFSE